MIEENKEIFHRREKEGILDPYQVQWHMFEILSLPSRKERRTLKKVLSEICLTWKLKADSPEIGAKFSKTYLLGKGIDSTSENVDWPHIYFTYVNDSPNLNFVRGFNGGKLIKGKLNKPTLEVYAAFNDQACEEKESFFEKIAQAIIPYLKKIGNDYRLEILNPFDRSL